MSWAPRFHTLRCQVSKALRGEYVPSFGDAESDVGSVLDFYRFWEHFVEHRMGELWDIDRLAWRELPYISTNLFASARSADPRLVRAPVVERGVEMERIQSEFVTDEEGLGERQKFIGRNRQKRERKRKRDRRCSRARRRRTHRWKRIASGKRARSCASPTP